MTSPPSFTYEHYSYILRAALDAGYEFIGYDDARPNSDRACVLRHDCDNDLTAAVRMAELEAARGIRSTYFLMLRSAQYNALSPSSAALVRRIIDHGHWMGLHFDARPHLESTDEALQDAVDAERKLLSTEFGAPFEVVSFHQPTALILENRVKIRCKNTYDRQDMEGFHYLSDSCMIWKEGCPSYFFAERRKPRLQLLIHPEWWTEDVLDIEGKWQRMLSNNFDVMQTSLLEREKSYPHRQAITFRRA